MSRGTTKRADELKVGDLVDMRRVYETVENFDMADYIVSESEYGKVEGVELETPECVRVDFENLSSFGFPVSFVVVVDDTEPHSFEGDEMTEPANVVCVVCGKDVSEHA